MTHALHAAAKVILDRMEPIHEDDRWWIEEMLYRPCMDPAVLGDRIRTLQLSAEMADAVSALNAARCAAFELVRSRMGLPDDMDVLGELREELLSYNTDVGRAYVALIDARPPHETLRTILRTAEAFFPDFQGAEWMSRMIRVEANTRWNDKMLAELENALRSLAALG